MQTKNNIEDKEWISAKAYAKKYDRPLSTVRDWIKKGFLTGKKLQTELSNNTYYQIPDAPPEQHPNFHKKKAAKKSTGKAYVRKAKRNKQDVDQVTLDGRKKKLEPYLKLFKEKAPEEKMFFLSQDVKKILGITNAELYDRWKKWGLKRYKLPAKTGETIAGGGRASNYVYSRNELIRFLSGDWDKEVPKNDVDDKLIRQMLGKEDDYQDGWYHYEPSKVYPFDGDGFIQWIKDKNVQRKDLRVNRWVPIELWDHQIKFVKEAFKLKPSGDYWYNLIVACWERGESKTFTIALMVIFRFFNRFGEVINLASESKELASFIHYNLIKGIINNTPELAKTPGLDVKEKEIALLRGPGDPVCVMKAVPTSSGLLPGTTCAVFTELHKFKDRQFFIDFWSSTRATPNAMTLVDTTVATKGHIVYSLWETYCSGEDPLLYFDHKQDDIRNPETTPEQLNSFKRQMLPQEYAMYFRNRWEDALGSLFFPNAVKKIGLAGVKVDNTEVLGQSKELDEALLELDDLKQERADLVRAEISATVITDRIDAIESSLITMDSLYKIPATREDLDMLQKKFGVGLMIGVGLDRSKLIGNMPDRTVLSCVARGIVDENLSIYFLLDIFIPNAPKSMFLQDKLIEWELEYDYIDKVTSEEYQAQDFHLWLEDQGYESEFVSATYKKQEELFTLSGHIINDGNLKSPTIPYYLDDNGDSRMGYSNRNDIFTEELGVFIFDPSKRSFGAPEKRKKSAPKDDCVYSVSWAIYACQGEDLADIKARALNASGDFIEIIPGNNMIGDYR
jgi:hypothetical protein